MSIRPLLAAVVLGAVAAPLAGQDSQFGVSGLGTAGRMESARARATAGAFAPFDAFSPTAEAALVDVTRGTIAATGYTHWRSLAYDSGATADVRQSRFPGLVVAWRSPWGFAVATGFASYLDRSADSFTRDSVLLRGVWQPYTDEIRADGGVMDLRFAAAGRPLRRVAVGAALHIITGSTKTSATRRWDDSVSYRTAREVRDVQYRGAGVSASLVADAGNGVRIAGWLRSDTRLRATVDEVVTSERDLPLRLGGGVEWRAMAQLRVAASVRWAGWAGAPNGHDALGWSLGAEAGSPTFPVRAGWRRDQLAFGPGGTAPVESGFAVGIARNFSGGRARLDVTVERLTRTGPGLEERAFTMLFGLTVQP